MPATNHVSWALALPLTPGVTHLWEPREERLVSIQDRQPISVGHLSRSQWPEVQAQQRRQQAQQAVQAEAVKQPHKISNLSRGPKGLKSRRSWKNRKSSRVKMNWVVKKVGFY